MSQRSVVLALLLLTCLANAGAAEAHVSVCAFGFGFGVDGPVHAHGPERWCIDEPPEVPEVTALPLPDL
jgi:hypothetical protein